MIEIGFGMGEHLITNAVAHPQSTLFGIELYKPGIAAVLSAIERYKLENCFILAGDAAEILNRLPENSIKKIDIHHPDPWPKKRHQKRQLLHQQFLNTCYQKLSSGGSMHIITDHQAYFSQTINLLTMMTHQMVIALEYNRKANSKYGRKATAKGQTINGITIFKPPSKQK